MEERIGTDIETPDRAASRPGRMIDPEPKSRMQWDRKTQ